MRESPTLEVVEIDGDRYADLTMAQQAALSNVARELATVVQEGIAGKGLVVVDGVVRLLECLSGACWVAKPGRGRFCMRTFKDRQSMIRVKMRDRRLRRVFEWFGLDLMIPKATASTQVGRFDTPCDLLEKYDVLLVIQ